MVFVNPAVVGLGAPLSRFLEGDNYKFLNERMNCNAGHTIEFLTLK